MSIERIARITTVEGNTYELPSEAGLQLWEVELRISHVDPRSGRSDAALSPSGAIHVERQTLVNAGLLPRACNDTPPPEDAETVEKLILRLLEHVGVFPE